MSNVQQTFIAFLTHRRRAWRMSIRMAAIWMAGVLVLPSMLVGSAAAAIGDVCPTLFTEYPLPYQSSSPMQMAEGFNGDVWFGKLSEQSVTYGRLGRILPNGAIVEYQNSPAGAGGTISDIVHGPDNAMWYTSNVGDQGTVGRIVDDGTTTEYTLPYGVVPGGITVGADNALWFYTSTNELYRVTTSGAMTHVSFSLPISVRPRGITLGADNNFWLTAEGNATNDISDSQGVLRIAPDGTYHYFEFPAAPSKGLNGIATGPDGAVWFTEYQYLHPMIGRVTTDGQLSEYPVDTNSLPIDIKTHGGQLWFSEGNGAIGRITTSSFKVDYFHVPDSMQSNLREVAITDTDIWVADQGQNKINRLPMPTGNYIAPPENVTGPRLTAKPTFSWDAAPNGSSYIVCRNGMQVSQVNGTSFIDNTSLTQGDYYYTLLTVDGQGLQSDRSRMFPVTVDTTPPTILSTTWSSNPLQQGQDTTLSVKAQDNFSAVKVFYSINGGARQLMTYTGGRINTWSATFGANLGVSTYTIDIIAVDDAGLETVQSDVLAVYGTSGYVSGHSKLTPDADDVLPIAPDAGHNPADVAIGFTNIKTAGQSVTGSFDVSYVVKNNRDEFSLSSTTIDSLAVPDANHATINGHADLTKYVNGVQTVTSNVSVRFEVTKGVNGAADQVVTKIYDAGSSTSGAPTWIVQGVSSGNIRIQQ
jgi:virginiamycin B lyase